MNNINNNTNEDKVRTFHRKLRKQIENEKNADGTYPYRPYKKLQLTLKDKIIKFANHLPQINAKNIVIYDGIKLFNNKFQAFSFDEFVEENFRRRNYHKIRINKKNY